MRLRLSFACLLALSFFHPTGFWLTEGWGPNPRSTTAEEIEGATVIERREPLGHQVARLKTPLRALSATSWRTPR